jgi:endonuclease/exonuclease/phosphatase family metal-dependent hydrolase
MTRFSRTFRLLLLFGLTFAGALFSPAQKIRIVAGNITSGNGQNYDEGHGIRIFQGVKPDIVLIQEFNYLSKSAADIREFVDTTFGTGFSYFRESNTGSIPNGVISRYPILESGQWVSTVAERDYAWARIDLPGSRELLAVSVHLPTASPGARNSEAQDLVGYINTYYAANGGARATDYLVVGGDFNTDVRSEACLTTLGAVVTIGTAHPADRNGNVNTNASRAKPYDAVYAGKGLHALQTATVVGASTFTNGLVADTREYSPVSEIAPAFASDSGASQMQHMAVVKDYQLPVPPDPPVLEILSSSLKTTAPRTAQITFRSTVGATYEVHAGNTMAAAAWTNLGSVTATTTSTAVIIVTTAPAAGQVRDPLLATATRRFYRVIRR